jgi:hypothetical protein
MKSTSTADLRCDRCTQRIDGIQGPGYTGGYYDVRLPSIWSQFARPDEHFVCDACMWADPRYIAVYGAMAPRLGLQVAPLPFVIALPDGPAAAPLPFVIALPDGPAAAPLPFVIALPDGPAAALPWFPEKS